MKKILPVIAIICFCFNAQLVFAQNTWSPKTCLPSYTRAGEAAFTVGNMGYIVGGYNLGITASNQVWQYNPNTDTWTQKNNFPNVITGPNCFVINDTAYVGVGLDAGGIYHTDFY